MAKIENILVATDFSDDAANALNYGQSLAQALGAKLYVLHVITNPTSHIYGEVEGDYLAMEKNAKVKAQTLMGQYSELLKGLPHHEGIVRAGEVVPIVLELIREKKIDTVVVGTHGHGPLRHLLMGSTCHKILQSIACPVVVVRHPDRAAA